nr:branched-chain amino acid transport system II carrier protein [Flavobacteriia bacterium]
PNPFGAALLEGYQTFDAIAAVVIGGVLIVSIHKSRSTAALSTASSNASSAATTPTSTAASTDASNPASTARAAHTTVHTTVDENTVTATHQMKKTLRFAAVFSATALALIYVGLIYAGAQSQGAFTPESSRTDILQGVAQMFLGGPGRWALSVLVSLACFTTAVGVVTGTADYVASFFASPRVPFVATAALGALLGVLMGQLPVVHIIAIAVPALVFIYPFTIILMALHALPAAWARPHAFKAAIVVCALANTPAFLDSLGYSRLQAATAFMPLSAQGLAWVLPVLGTVFVCRLISIMILKSD